MYYLEAKFALYTIFIKHMQYVLYMYGAKKEAMKTVNFMASFISWNI